MRCIPFAGGFICGGGRMAEKKSQTNAMTWPAERQALVLAGYRFKYARPCRLCKATIEFWSTPNRKLIPLDRQADERRVPHWSTCPNAAEFRKSAKQGDLFSSANPVETRKNETT